MKDIVLVTGSTAIDQTGLYPGSFEDYQSRYGVNAFNASFQLAAMKTSFGGCASSPQATSNVSTVMPKRKFFIADLNYRTVRYVIRISYTKEPKHDQCQ